MNSLALTSAALLAFGGFFGGLAMAQDKPFGEMVGLCVKFSQGEPPEAIKDMLELGNKLVRRDINWVEIEPTPGRYVSKFPPALKAELDFYKANGIKLVCLLSLENWVAYPNSPENPHNSTRADKFGLYASHVATLLKAHGVNFVIEIGNEPHNFSIGPQYGIHTIGSWNGQPPSPWLDQYVSMVHEAVARVKAVDPAIKLMSCDDMWIIHYWMLEKGTPSETWTALHSIHM